MEKDEIKTPKGTIVQLRDGDTWPLANSWRVKIEGKTYHISDEAIYRAGGWKQVGKTKYEISEGGKLRIRD